MRSILNLLSAIDSKDYKSIVDSICFFGLHPYGKFFSRILHDSEDIQDHDAFRVHFCEYELFCTNLPLDFPDQVLSYINTLYRYYNDTSGEDTDFLDNYDFMYYDIGHGFASIISKLCSFTSILSVSELGEVKYSDPLTSKLIASKMDPKVLIEFSNAYITEVINTYISYVTPMLEYKNFSLTGDWLVPNLLSANVKQNLT